MAQLLVAVALGSFREANGLKSGSTMWSIEGGWLGTTSGSRNLIELRRDYQAVQRRESYLRRRSLVPGRLRLGSASSPETSPEPTPWTFMRSHSEVAIARLCGENQTSSPWCELPGTSEVRCVATAQHHLVWRRCPRTVLLLAKMQATEDELEVAAKIAASLCRCGATVYLTQPLYGTIVERLRERHVKPVMLWLGGDDAQDNLHEASVVAATDRPDAVATFGGDGLLLYANSLFQTVSPPPLVAFSGGSLGFLAPFHVPDDVEDLDAEFMALLRVGTGEPPAPWPVSLRMRLRCRLIATNGTELVRHEALNEVVIDRGTSRFLSAVECYCNNEHLTTVQADGLIVATPTGSTAYSLAAGGPLVHPSTPAIVMTPICAHSLSFRPITFPDSVSLRFHIQGEARSPAFVTIDGRQRTELSQGQSLEVTVSPYPLPTLLRVGNTADWFDALRDAFNFNTRVHQKPMRR